MDTFIPQPDALVRTATGQKTTRPRTIEEFAQFLHWAGPPDIPAEQAPLRYIASWWYHGLITIEEGKLIEEGRTLR